MSRSFAFEPVERLTAGATGEPGGRTFYVQANAAGEQVTLLAEKEQVNALGEALVRLLESLPEADEGPEPGDDDLELREPLEPDWRAGSMSIEYEAEPGRVVITINEAVPEEEERQQPSASARFVATRAQVRAMAAHALAVVAAGRPRCNLCGAPIEPDGPHMCATMNGHRKFGD